VHQVEHQRDVFFPAFRDADRSRRSIDAGLVALLLGGHDAPLDLAHVVHVVVHSAAIANPKSR